MMRLNAMAKLAAVAAMVMSLQGCVVVDNMKIDKSRSTNVTGAVEQEEVQGAVFIHLSHGADDSQRALMALKMADLMSDDEGLVMVYCDIKAAGLLCKGAPELKGACGDPSSAELIARLVKKQVTLMVCPSCLKAAGKTPQDLIEGVQIADKETMLEFAQGGGTLSFTY